MKHLLFSLSLAAFVTVVIAEDSLKIPKGVRYEKTTDEINKAAKSLALARFSGNTKDEDILSLFETMVICGPGLWQDIKTNSVMAKLDKGKAEFHVPVFARDGTVERMDKLEGNLFQSADEILLFWKTFAQRTDLSELTARKLNPNEIEIFWAMIPFDITEPLFILESKKNKVLIVFTSPEKLKIMWIDDYQNLSMKEQAISNKPDESVM